MLGDLNLSLIGDPHQEYIELGGLCRRGIQLEAEISLALIQTIGSKVRSTRNIDRAIPLNYSISSFCEHVA